MLKAKYSVFVLIPFLITSCGLTSINEKLGFSKTQSPAQKETSRINSPIQKDAPNHQSNQDDQSKMLNDVESSLKTHWTGFMDVMRKEVDYYDAQDKLNQKMLNSKKINSDQYIILVGTLKSSALKAITDKKQQTASTVNQKISEFRNKYPNLSPQSKEKLKKIHDEFMQYSEKEILEFHQKYDTKLKGIDID